MSGLEFVARLPDKTPPERKRGKWDLILDALRARPCEWAVVRKQSDGRTPLAQWRWTTVRQLSMRVGEHLEIEVRGDRAFARWVP